MGIVILLQVKLTSGADTRAVPKEEALGSLYVQYRVLYE